MTLFQSTLNGPRGARSGPLRHRLAPRGPQMGYTPFLYNSATSISYFHVDTMGQRLTVINSDYSHYLVYFSTYDRTHTWTQLFFQYLSIELFAFPSIRIPYCRLT